MIQANENITIHARRFRNRIQGFLNAEIRQIITKSDWDALPDSNPIFWAQWIQRFMKWMNLVEKQSYHVCNITSQTFLLSTVCGEKATVYPKSEQGNSEKWTSDMFRIPRSSGEFEINSPAHFLDPIMLFLENSSS